MELKHELVGTVQVLRTRIYPLDAEGVDWDNLRTTTVVVEPDEYPVYRVMDIYYWVMAGRVNQRGSKKIGEGMFTLSPHDEPMGPKISVLSKRFSLSEFNELCALEMNAGVERSLVFHMTEES